MITAQDLMTTQPFVTTPDATIGEALRYMQADAIRHIPVVNMEQKLVGIITDRDIRLAMNSEHLQAPSLNAQILSETIVADCMTTSVMTVAPDTPAYQVSESLSAFKFDCLPVVDDQKLVGIVTVTDILEHYSALTRSKEGVA